MYKLTEKDLAKLKLEHLLYKPHVCNAPFVSLNFSQSGNINVCCMSRRHSLGYYPSVSILQAWGSLKLNELRTAIDSFDFSKGCDMCYKQIISGNYQNSLLNYFDDHQPVSHFNFFPTVMQFEMSTICNYECIMCGGKWSSSIRKNRENLPPLITPYDDKFVKQLEFFIPHLRFAQFLGGEPFATPIYYSIWEKFIELNSTAGITITTNGSIYNNRVKDILKRNENMRLCLSIDSLNEETYKFIRKNGNLLTVLDNLKKIKEDVGMRLDAVAFCPMRQNWHEIPQIIDFCREQRIGIGFNNVEGHLGGTVYGIHENAPKKSIRVHDEVTDPVVTNTLTEKIPEVSLFTLTKEEKIEIISFLQNLDIPESKYKSPVSGLINRLICSIQQ